MSLDEASQLIRDTLLLALAISAPMLVIGLVVGIFVSVLQAITQIQEQTLAFVTKIAAMVGAAIALMPWMCHRLMEYATQMIINGQVR
jgi:flagellar biosynthesis protein FliQ